MSTTPLPPGNDSGTIDKFKRVRALRRDMLGYMLDLQKTYGDVTYFSFGAIRSYMVNDPEMIHQILVKQAKQFRRSRTISRLIAPLAGNGLIVADGDFWRKQRKLMQPAFHHKRIQQYAEIMVDATQRMVASWQDGEVRDVAADMMGLTLQIVVRTMFGAGITQIHRVGEAVEQVQRAVEQLAMLFFPMPTWFPHPANKKMKEAVKVLDEILMPIIQQRRKSNEDTGDLLSMLLMAAYEEGGQMTNKQVRDEAMSIFVAGHETTSNTLAWTWYLLSQNPEVEEKLRHEIETVLVGRPPTVNDLPNLPYTDKVIKEALRLYPPAFTITREPIEDTRLGGYKFLKGGVIIMSPYVLHRTPSLFPEPEKFDPERFTPEAEKSRHRDAYLPFGDGPHVCIGNVFATMEAKLILTTIMQRYRLNLIANQVVEPEPLITLRPRYGIRMELQRLNRAHHSTQFLQ